MTAADSYKPIINSVNDLQIKRDVKATVNKGLLADVIFQVKSFHSSHIIEFPKDRINYWTHH